MILIGSVARTGNKMAWRPAPGISVRGLAIMAGVKARVFVSLKKTVLDPQGQTVRSALIGLGYQSVSEVRQGKYFEIALAPGTSREQGAREIDTMARDVLTNPVIEEYKIEISE
jgi:phosphoribosylformylglycinamidine synthase PurS subunit